MLCTLKTLAPSARYSTFKDPVTLKSGLGVTQGHQKLCHSMRHPLASATLYPPVPRWSQKWGGHCPPHTLGSAAHGSSHPVENFCFVNLADDTGEIFMDYNHCWLYKKYMLYHKMVNANRSHVINHLCHKNLRPGSASRSTMYKFFSHLVWSSRKSWLAYVRGPKNLGAAAPPPLGAGAWLGT